MQALITSSQLIETAISNLELPNSPNNLYDPLRYFMTLGGKRMRPVFTLLAAEMFGKLKEEALPAALAVELFHNFSLIHDDIMDEAPLRRKQQTVHTKWNMPIAILSGDVLLVKAYQELCKQDPKHLADLMEIFNRTAVEVCEGQQKDMDFETQEQVELADYIEMIRLKTSVLLGCAMELGAIVADQSLEHRKLAYEFGVEIGLAFQIQDDILDLYADPEKFGKQVGGDVLSNKKTFLYLRALEVASENDKKEIHTAYERLEGNEKIEVIKEIYNRLGIRELARVSMEMHYNKGMRALEKIAVSIENKKPLEEIAILLLNREN
jgi:geranylgeranyl diphosphate synthase type II